MRMKDHKSKLISRVVSKGALEQNAKALKSYKDYKKTADIMERANLALGKKPVFKTGIGSTLNFKINQDGVSSTTAQKI